ncbi:formamidase [Streptomyces puniciscabiei]|uniref:Formamidase n=1 Tax=Streptomyces puniciscabiei TaxID=164348 RepID=A0A542UA86_9ACTN|nr:carbon-nitrogen hydrolase family protein [Streptomyces puniciscabiei]TQK95965.1 formamidase [Streptomyces puniciscabiei]
MRTNTLTIAALQTAPVPHDLEASWQRYADQVRATRSLFPHVQLVVVPELLLAAEAPLLRATGGWTDQAAVTVPGPLTDRVCALAAETGLWLVPGSLYERTADGTVFNTALAVSPEGEIVARYRKVFPWQPYETTTPGTAFTVFDIPGTARIGLAICYDGSFPETARQLAWLGADIIIQPTLTTTRDREMELVMARANAWTNQVYVVNVNAADPAGVGMSTIVDPEGVVRQQAGTGEEILVDTLDPGLVDRVRALGSNGLNRPWSQLARYGGTIHLPAYQGGTFQRPVWAAEADERPSAPEPDAPAVTTPGS